MDCSSFTKEVVKVAVANSKSVYIRAQRCNELYSQLQEVKQWKTVKIGLYPVEVCSIQYAPFREDQKYGVYAIVGNV